jgi:hypothetical protein
MKKLKHLLKYIFTFALIFSLSTSIGSAKTIHSARADNIFFYAVNSRGKSVLLKVMPLSELKKLSHGQKNGSNYYISTTDNYPTTQYCEARGFTIDELVAHVKSVTSVDGAQNLSFSGSDTLSLMATDSYGNYSRSWTYDKLYGVKRYYFEGLYDTEKGWNTGWEIAGEDNSKFGITLDEYNVKYKDADPFYADKRAVFAGGKETTVILATESYSGRTTSRTLIASAEPGLAGYIEDNGGVAAGCLRNAITDETALRLSLPPTEADLMAAHRTAYDNFKWIYNMKLEMAEAPDIKSSGTVAEPVPAFTLSGDGKTLVIDFSCETPGADIYYSFDGAPQLLFTGTVKYNITDRKLSSEPVTVYATAVREGYDDAGILTFKYPCLAPSFQTVYSAMTGKELAFTASIDVSDKDWADWTGRLDSITIKRPSDNDYTVINKSDYTVDGSSKTIIFNKKLFTENGSCSFVFYADKYADKALTVNMKTAVPAASTAEIYKYGEPVTLSFTDGAYQSSLYIYVTRENGSRTMISTNYLDRSSAGKVTIKAEYFRLPSAVIKGSGLYTLEFNNNSYSPSSQVVKIRLTGGYADVKADAWYYNAVIYTSDMGLFDATDEGFSPDAKLTRLMLTGALYRLSGSPEVTEVSPFTDCSVASVIWAADAGIVEGMGGGKFMPDGNITREQAAVMLYRYAKYTGGDMSASSNITKFNDYTEISDWAEAALSWAVGHKLINGMGDGNIAPRSTATRAMTAQILLNYSALKK